MKRFMVLGICLMMVSPAIVTGSPYIDLQAVSVAAAPSISPAQKNIYFKILTEEVKRRTGLLWDTSGKASSRPLLVFATATDSKFTTHRIPAHQGDATWEKPEGFRVCISTTQGRTVIWLIGQDHRGLIYSIGQLLTNISWSTGKARISSTCSIASAPAYSLRGHQLGYRNTANSWDAWTPRQMEQYIRDLVLTGSNAIENIPFTKPGESPLFQVMPDSMNRFMSRVCHDYGIEYWVWTPCQADLSDSLTFQREVLKHRDFYASTPHLGAVFVPGGDPGDNHPKFVLPFLKAIAGSLKQFHPAAGVWVSLQGFSDEQVNYFYDYLENSGYPDWLAGVVTGPGSPSISETRYRLHPKYKHRHYADITHNVRCELPVRNWDQAFSLTLGREASNPRPVFHAATHAQWAPFTDGFLSYSDGVHDDVNKFVWNRKAWDPAVSAETMMLDYVRFYFGETFAPDIAEGILALERNWAGPVEDNGGIAMTLRHWTMLEQQLPGLRTDWRWQLLVIRAYYDAWQKGRKIYEQSLERDAMTILKQAGQMGTEKAMQASLAKVQEAVTSPYDTLMRARIVEYCKRLYQSVQLQTSVPLFRASGSERGAILDHLDHPLNNRWWLEDEFLKAQKLGSESEKLKALHRIAAWEEPGEGSYYDDISNVSKSPRVKSIVDDATDFLWENDGRSRKRLSTQTYQNFPVLEYRHLNPKAKYMIRISGYGDALLRVDGKRIEPVLYGKDMEAFKEFLIDPKHYSDGQMNISFDQPEESHLNWRQHSKVSDIWLIRTDQ